MTRHDTTRHDTRPRLEPEDYAGRIDEELQTSYTVRTLSVEYLYLIVSLFVTILELYIYNIFH